VVIEEGNKAANSSLEVNVVLPERIVRVNQEGLGKQSLSS
jgi:hypothetical protein